MRAQEGFKSSVLKTPRHKIRLASWMRYNKKGSHTLVWMRGKHDFSFDPPDPRSATWGVLGVPTSRQVSLAWERNTPEKKFVRPAILLKCRVFFEGSGADFGQFLTNAAIIQAQSGSWCSNFSVCLTVATHKVVLGCTLFRNSLIFQ